MRETAHPASNRNYSFQSLWLDSKELLWAQCDAFVALNPIVIAEGFSLNNAVPRNCFADSSCPIAIQSFIAGRDLTFVSHDPGSIFSKSQNPVFQHWHWESFGITVTAPLKFEYSFIPETPSTVTKSVFKSHS